MSSTGRFESQARPVRSSAIHRIALIAAFIALSWAPAAAQSGINLAGPDAAAAIDKIFAAYEGTIKPGCALGIWRDGKIVYTRGYGMANLEYNVPITPETIFEAGSVSKQFAAAAIQLLCRDGKLALSDDVRKFVPEVPMFGPLITLKHLLTHTSGIRDQWGLLTAAGRPPGRAVHTLDEILDLVSRQHDLNFAPGADYLYSNTGYALMAWVVRRASGQSLSDFSMERIFKPLGMSSTRWRDDFTEIVKGRATAYSQERDGAYHQDMSFTNVYGNGGLLTTVGDLLVWAENFWTPRVLDRAALDEMEIPMILNDGTPTIYGLGLNVSEYKGIREVSHSGSTAGYRAFLVRYPDQKAAIAVLSNFGGANPSNLAHRVADILLAGALKPNPAIQPIKVAPEDLQARAGLYRDPKTDAILELVVTDGRLAENRGPSLLCLGPGRFMTTGGTKYFFDAAGERNRPVVRAVATGAAPATYERVEPARPTPEALAEYAGLYWSDELEVAYIAAVKEGKLTLRRRPDAAMVLEPTYKDGFVARPGAGGSTLYRFTRDKRGRIDGFTANTGRVRHLRFIKK
jgi:CubicO group peptidase (beta-lactamase class C family)